MTIGCIPSVSQGRPVSLTSRCAHTSFLCVEALKKGGISWTSMSKVISAPWSDLYRRWSAWGSLFTRSRYLEAIRRRSKTCGTS